MLPFSLCWSERPSKSERTPLLSSQRSRTAERDGERTAPLLGNDRAQRSAHRALSGTTLPEASAEIELGRVSASRDAAAPRTVGSARAAEHGGEPDAAHVAPTIARGIDLLLGTGHGGGPEGSATFRARLRGLPWLGGAQAELVTKAIELARGDAELARTLGESLDLTEPETREGTVVALREAANGDAALADAARALRDVPAAAFSRQLGVFLELADRRPEGATAIRRACAEAFSQHRFSADIRHQDVDALLEAVSDDVSLGHLTDGLLRLREPSAAASDQLCRIGTMTTSSETRRKLAAGLRLHPSERRFDALRALCAPGDAQTCTQLVETLRLLTIPNERILACMHILDATHDPATVTALLGELRRWDDERPRSVVKPDRVIRYALLVEGRRTLLRRIREQVPGPHVRAELASMLDCFSPKDAAEEFTHLRGDADEPTAAALAVSLRALPPFLAPVEFRRLRESATARGDLPTLTALRDAGRPSFGIGLESVLSPLEQADGAWERETVDRALARVTSSVRRL